MKAYAPSNEQISALCSALGHLLGAGIAPGDACLLLAEQEQASELKAALEMMARRADEGISMASLFRNAGCFPSYVCTLLEVGETVGQAEHTLLALGRYYEARDRMNSRLKASLTYPTALFGVLLGVMVVLLVWVLPIFSDVYAQLGSSLTGLAGFLLGLGQLLGTALPWLCAAVALILLAAVIKPVRLWTLHFFKIRFGDKFAFGQVNSAHFLQALALAVSSGMTDAQAVQMASRLSESEAPAFAARCQKCLELLDNGSTLSHALQEASLLRPADARLLEAGARSGRSESILHDIAQNAMERSEEALERAAGKAEPALVTAACVMIGIVLFSVMLPLMNIMNAIG